MAEQRAALADRCVDCGAVVSMCEHAAKRLIDVALVSNDVEFAEALPRPVVHYGVGHIVSSGPRPDLVIEDETGATVTDITSIDDARGMLGTEVVAAFRAVQAERDQYHKRWSAVLTEHHQFMNDMLEALDLEIDEDGAYILDQIVTAARQMREDRAALAVTLTEMRAAFRQAQLGPIPGGTACWLCQSSWRHDEPEQHTEGCGLAQPAPERGVALLKAAEDLWTELQDAAFGWEGVPWKVQRDAREALDCWRALRPASDGQRGG